MIYEKRSSYVPRALELPCDFAVFLWLWIAKRVAYAEQKMTADRGGVSAEESATLDIIRDSE